MGCGKKLLPSLKGVVMGLYRVQLTDGEKFDVSLAPAGHVWAADVAGHRFQLRLLGACRQDGLLVEINGRRVCLSFDSLEADAFLRELEAVEVILPSQRKPGGAAAPEATDVASPIAGIVLSAQVSPGQVVKRGDALFVVEAMKMENVIRASHDGVVSELHCREGDVVCKGQPLMGLSLSTESPKATPHTTEARVSRSKHTERRIWRSHTPSHPIASFQAVPA